MRNPSVVSAFLSFLCMGLGQLKNRQYGKGILLLLLNAAGWLFFLQKLPHAMWGITSLGDVGDHMEKVGKFTEIVHGDHSIFLMLEGLIILVVLTIFLLIYVLNVRDAYVVARQIAAGGVPNSLSMIRRKLLEQGFPYFILSVPILLVVFFTVMPILFMILLAFTNYSAPNHVPPAKLVDWTGFQAFIDLFQIKAWKNTFFGVATWTLIWAALATLTTFMMGFAVALVVQWHGIRLKTFWRTIYIIPYAIPQFVSLLVMRNIFNGQFGPINEYLSYFGLGKVPWITDPFWAKVTVIVVNMWIGFPISMLMIIGILTTIPRDMYEAAEIDGASRSQQFRFITFPAVMFAMGPILVLTFAGNLNNFSVIYLLTQGGPTEPAYQFAGSTDILITWLYNLSVKIGKYSMASVVGILIFIVVASFSIWNIRRTKSFREEDLA